MKSRTIIAVLAMVMGGLLGSTTSAVSAAEGSQQCYYRSGIDPENSCTRCSETCLGSGYRCCTIVADLEQSE